MFRVASPLFNEKNENKDEKSVSILNEGITLQDLEQKLSSKNKIGFQRKRTRKRKPKYR